MLKLIITIIITAIVGIFIGHKITPQEVVVEFPNITQIENVGAPPIDEEPQPEPEPEIIKPEFRTVASTSDRLGVDLKTFSAWANASNTATHISFEYKGVVLYDDFDHAGWNNCRNGMWGTSTPEFCDLKTTEQQKSGAMINKIEQYEAKLKRDSQIDYSNELK